jgi:hypothetical protein
MRSASANLHGAKYLGLIIILAKEMVEIELADPLAGFEHAGVSSPAVVMGKEDENFLAVIIVITFRHFLRSKK